MNAWLRTLRRHLAASGSAAGNTPDFATFERPTIQQIFRRQSRVLAGAITLVRVFYIMMFFILLQQYPSWSGWLGRYDTLHPLWPVRWIPMLGIVPGIAIVIFGSLGACLLAALFPSVRACRAFAAFALLEFAAFFNSFGATGHGLHASIWTAFLFILLPDGTPDVIAASRRRAQRYLRVFWSAQAAVLLFYSLSGSFKILGIIVQFSRGEVNALMPQAMSRFIAERLMETMPTGAQLVGPWFIDHPYAGWPMHVMAIYLEAFSFVVAFRPTLHRLWGACLILMHLGIYFTMSIMFSWQCLLVGLLLVCSPLAPPRVRLTDILQSLPVFGDALRLARRAARTRRVWPAPTPAPAPAAPDLDDEPELQLR